MYLRQSTASQEILLGPFVDDTDGKTAETALTITNTDIKLWKGGTTTESNKNSGGGTHIAGGRYSVVLDATDTDTVGMLEVNVHVAGALPVRRAYYVLEEAVYDALFAASAAGYQVPIWATAGSTVSLSATTIATVTDLTNMPTIPTNWITASGINTGAITNAKFAAGAIDAAAIAADAITDAKVASDVTIASVTGAVGSVTGNVGGNVVGSVASVTAAVTVGTINANAVTASALATDAVSEIADGVLTRNASNVESTAGEHTLCTVVLAMLENSISGTTLTIKRTDGSTTHFTKTLTTNAAADPITGIT